MAYCKPAATTSGDSCAGGASSLERPPGCCDLRNTLAEVEDAGGGEAAAAIANTKTKTNATNTRFKTINITHTRS